MQSACSRKGIKLLLVSDSELDSIDSSRLDGIVFMRNFEAVDKVKDSGVPVLLVNRFSDDERISYIAVDYREESRRGIEFLISQGHKKIGVIGAYAESNVCRWRTDGYLDAMKKHGLHVDDDWILRINDFSKELYPQIKNYLANVDVSALFILTAAFLFPTGTALYELGDDKFNHFSLLCFDDVEDAVKHPGPPVSSILMPLKEMGEKAVEYLEKKIDDPKLPPMRELVKADLMIRQHAEIEMVKA
jgi:LacI family transcriptional regulator